MARKELNPEEIEQVAGGNITMNWNGVKGNLSSDVPGLSDYVYNFTNDQDIISDFKAAEALFPNDEVARDSYFLNLIVENNHAVKTKKTV